MPYYSEDLIEEIRAGNDIVDVVSRYVNLQKRGNTYMGLCPFHNEKTPSFSVSEGKRIFYCFGCGVGGDVFAFIQKHENYTFPEAVRFLAQRASIPLPEAEASQEERRQAGVKSTLLAINKLAAEYYYYRLTKGRDALGLDYFTGRGISGETIRRFGLGYTGNGGAVYRYLREKGYSDELLVRSGLVKIDERRGGYDRFFNRAMFPIMDINSHVIGFGGRVLGEGMPKYLNSPETEIFDKSRNLYGMNFARSYRGEAVILCEGYMDVIALHQAGFTNAVASLGTSFTMGQASLLKRYAKTVFLAYDSDGAGVKAALRAIQILNQAGLSPRVVDLSPHKDPDEFIKALGKEAFEERLTQAENGFLFEIGRLEQHYDIKDPRGKTEFLNEVAKKLLSFQNEIERDNYIDAMAAQYGVVRDKLQKLVMQYGAFSMQEEALSLSRHKPRKKEKGGEKAQRLLLTWLVEEEMLFPIVRKYVSPEDFTTPLLQRIAGMLYEQFAQEARNPAKIISALEDEQEQQEAAAIFNARLEGVSTPQEKEEALRDVLYAVKQGSLAQAAGSGEGGAGSLQQLIERKRILEEIEKLHISFN